MSGLRTCWVCCSPSDLVRSAQYPHGPSTSSQVARFRSFLLLRNTPVCVCVSVCMYTHCIFSIHSSVDTRVACTLSSTAAAPTRSRQRSARAPFSPRPRQPWCADSLTTAILTGARRSLIVASVSIFLMTSDAEHLFLCLSAVRMSSSDKNLSTSFATFLIGLFDFLLLRRVTF